MQEAGQKFSRGAGLLFCAGKETPINDVKLEIWNQITEGQATELHVPYYPQFHLHDHDG